MTFDQAASGFEIRVESFAQAVDVGARTAVFSPWVVDVERFGLVVRGVIWGIVGVVATGVAAGIAVRALDLQGAIALIASNPWRLPVAGTATLGLVAYALWGYARAIFDPLGRGHRLNGLLARLGFLWSAFSYSALSFFAAQLALGGMAGAGSTLPFGLEQSLHRLGPGAVVAAGVLVSFTGLGQFTDSWRAPFRDDVRLRASHHRLWLSWLWLGRFGTFSRGVVFTGIGAATILAGLRGDAHWAYGIAEFFSFVVGLPAGAYVIAVVACGFVALGLHSVMAAPWMRMRPNSLGLHRVPQEVQ